MTFMFTHELKSATSDIFHLSSTTHKRICHDNCELILLTIICLWNILAVIPSSFLFICRPWPSFCKPFAPWWGSNWGVIQRYGYLKFKEQLQFYFMKWSMKQTQNSGGNIGPQMAVCSVWHLDHVLGDELIYGEIYFDLYNLMKLTF